MTKPDMTDSITAMKVASICVTIIIMMLAAWMTFISNKVDANEKAASCLTPRTEWAARNVYMDNMIMKLRDEAEATRKELKSDIQQNRAESRQDTENMNRKLDRILEKIK